MSNNLIIIILGATGDLARRKIIPAVYSIIQKKEVNQFALICAAIDDTSIESILGQTKEFIENFEQESWEKLCTNAYYKKLNFESLKDFKKLTVFVDSLENTFKENPNRLVYAASMPDYFCKITKNCALSNLVKSDKANIEKNITEKSLVKDGEKKSLKQVDCWHRIIYEKPFGRDLKSAKAINRCIAKYFSEEQIYRVDHYLTKEIVTNIDVIRFANCVFEPLWNNKFIDYVEIILDEKISIGDRGKYYDRYGAVRDVVQNHILELLALVAMERPKKLSGDFIVDQRLKVLKKVKVIDGIFGQYSGYKNEKFVDQNSNTETYAELVFNINNKRWSGINFYAKTGKCLAQKTTEINIKFKKCDCILLNGCPVENNCLTINIYPKGAFILSLNIKKPGAGESEQIVPVHMEFCHFCEFKDFLSESYEIIIQEVMARQKAVSVRFDEIEWLWKITQEIYNKNFKLLEYKVGHIGKIGR